MALICVLGHITKDIIRRPEMPDVRATGGSAYYAAVAAARLGSDAVAITRGAAADRPAVEALLRCAGVEVLWRDASATTEFELSYAPDGERGCRVLAVAEPFSAADLGPAEGAVLHLGPLTRDEMSLEFLAAASAAAQCVSLDVQGLLRVAAADGSVHLQDWPGKTSALEAIDVLKAAREEAEILTGETDPERAARRLAAFGSREVIVTLAEQGSLIRVAGRTHHIPAYRPQVHVDATGCGDTYMAGYLHSRTHAQDFDAAGRFAAATATLKLEGVGPFAGSADRVRELLRAAGSAPH